MADVEPSEVAASGVTPEDQKKSPGVMLDSAMRKISVHNLCDYYMDSYIDIPHSKVSIYFSDRIPTEGLQTLKDSLEDVDLTITTEQTEAEGAGWILRIMPAQSVGPEQVPIKGQIGLDVSLNGKVDIA
jgi:hypothetical protein